MRLQELILAADRTRALALANRPENTRKSYEPKMKEFRDWCVRKKKYEDGDTVTELKLYLFLLENVVFERRKIGKGRLRTRPWVSTNSVIRELRTKGPLILTIDFVHHYQERSAQIYQQIQAHTDELVDDQHPQSHHSFDKNPGPSDEA